MLEDSSPKPISPDNVIRVNNFNMAGTNMDLTEERSPSPYHFVNPNHMANGLAIAIQDGIDTITLFVAAKSGKIPNKHPKLLKAEFTKILDNTNGSDFMKVTKEGKIIIVTKSAEVAQKILNLQTIMNIPVDTFIQKETITTRFLLNNINTEVDCKDIAEELTSNGMFITEARRFIRKINGESVPTSTVLITKLGTSLPPEVKLWYQLFRIKIFWDKPRRCLNCHKYNHSVKACRSQRICIRCAEPHDGACTSQTAKCPNCKKDHEGSDKSCPHYLKEAEIQKFRSLNHLTLSEARRRFRDDEKTASQTYAVVTSSFPTSNPPPVDYVTKADLESTLHTFAESMTGLFQQLLQAQMQAFQNMISTVTQTAFGAAQKLIVDQSSNSLSQKKRFRKVEETPPLPTDSSLQMNLSSEISGNFKNIPQHGSNPLSSLGS